MGQFSYCTPLKTRDFDLSNDEGIDSFRSMIYSFFDEHGRILPWRTDYTPYDIFISEVMLQQTQVERVIPKFTEFKNRFPDFRSLAGASLDQVLAAWQGMGYNRRAVYLRDAARIIVEKFDGSLPTDPRQLHSLPGIGSATAASIAAFAFNAPVVFLETNIRTVYIYHFFESVTEPVPDSALYPVSELLLDRLNPRKWYSALMDYGTVLKKSVGNLSRKSTMYQKQTPFKNSNRFLRGAILRHLLKGDARTAKKLSSFLQTDTNRIQSVLQTLLDENIVIKRGAAYHIAK
ncbi:MAG: A/G-specific adenine glycosylase [Fibrobacter sp.]|nr:A/G-specific adenine glycosylase [Fibrobacter sp.]